MVENKTDIEIILDKCETDKDNAEKYARLVLLIEPENEKALEYLKDQP